MTYRTPVMALEELFCTRNLPLPYLVIWSNDWMFIRTRTRLGSYSVIHYNNIYYILPIVVHSKRLNP